eukprot:gnl/TRDRNA2_/TRDRNA2_109260_c0_seq1.p1 gnl/TRDRNA2_/TRDRNA2_109260_c0~~gnl/TRDRNA2_/TRDRNA2_109260_c0_seq1.p1  ORF type:complete len:135 (-),score=12.52 gnl/TRDRNA2_/TRDRNA2_109260_c0_seq1:209-613(-)
MILYQYEGSNDWQLNGIHCISGYVYIKATRNITHITSFAGQVHGKLYKSLFGMEPESVVGTGFAFQNGQWKWNSYVFNTTLDGYHDLERTAGEFEQQMIMLVVKCAPGTTVSTRTMLDNGPTSTQAPDGPTDFL